MQASQETLRRETQRPSQQHKHPRGKPGQQRAGASGELDGIFEKYIFNAINRKRYRMKDHSERRSEVCLGTNLST